MQDIEDHETILYDLGLYDYEPLVALWQQAGLSIRQTGRDGPAAFARQLTLGTQRVIGLRAADRLVAAAVLTHDGRKGWINRLAVHPDWQRQGLASRLVTEAERWFTDDLGLEVWAALIEEENAPSLALFDRLGFQRHAIVYVSKRRRAEA